MTVLNVPYIRNNATGSIEPMQVLRNDIVNGLPLDDEPLVMPKLNFGHGTSEEPGSVLRQHVTKPNNGMVISNGVAIDTDPLVMPRLDFSYRVNNEASCGCQSKPAAVTNSNGYDDEPLVMPGLKFGDKR